MLQTCTCCELQLHSPADLGYACSRGLAASCGTVMSVLRPLLCFVVQGFASGDLDQDAAALRMFTRAGEGGWGTAVLHAVPSCKCVPAPQVAR